MNGNTNNGDKNMIATTAYRNIIDSKYVDGTLYDFVCEKFNALLDTLESGTLSEDNRRYLEAVLKDTGTCLDLHDATGRGDDLVHAARIITRLDAVLY